MIRNRSEDIAHCQHHACPLAEQCYRHLTREEQKQLAKRGFRYLSFDLSFTPENSERCFMP